MDATTAGSGELTAHVPTQAAHRWLIRIALAFGLAFAALTLSPGYVGGNGAYWQYQHGDPGKGEIGWFYYARDDWRFPLFDARNTHYPEGGSVVLADSLPLFALPAKAAYRAFWPTGSDPPVYTGLWVALCLVLQAVFASRLLRALAVIDAVAHVAGVVLFCHLPIVFLRFGQAALMGQFVILFALEGYVRAKRTGLTRGQWIAQCASPVLALLVTPYLSAMCGAVLAATILDQWRERRIAAQGVVLRFGFVALAAIALMAVGGFFGATSSQFGDYGLYSMNLLSPWVPFPQTLAGQLLHTEMQVITGSNQWEGGAYLGAGVLALCALALPALRRWHANLRRHAVLLCVLCGVLLFAVSQRVGIGAREVLTIPLPDALIGALSQLRGSGRFVWVPVYALLAALVVAVPGRHRRWGRWLLVAAAILQLVDTRPMQAGVRAASASAAPSTIDVATWTRLIAAHGRIFQFPSFECGGLFGNGVPGNKFRGVEIDWIAAKQARPTNSAYLARFTKDCARERLDAAGNHGRPGVLYLYRSSDDIGAYLVSHGVDGRQCGYLDDVVVCSVDAQLPQTH